MANVALGRRLLKGRERHNVAQLKKYAGLVISQEQRDKQALLDGKTNTPGIIFDTTTNAKKTSLQDVIVRCNKGLGWLAKGHGIPNPDGAGDLP